MSGRLQVSVRLEMTAGGRVAAATGAGVPGGHAGGG